MYHNVSASLHFRSPVLALAALLLTIGFISGCDNAIDPFSEQGIYSIYGYLTLAPERQYIRVKALDAPLLPDSTRTLDATVTLENLDTGTATTLRDSVVAFGDVFAHNFYTDAAIAPNTEYRITVERYDGATTRATTTTPSILTVTAAPETGNCLATFQLTWETIPEIRRLTAWVGFDYGEETYWIQAPGQGLTPVGEGASLTFSPEPVLAEIIPSQDNPNTEFRYEPRCLVLSSNEVYVRYRQLGPTWFGDVPEGDFTFDPTESRFIDGGLGFFGSLRRDTLSVTVDTANVIELSP